MDKDTLFSSFGKWVESSLLAEVFTDLVCKIHSTTGGKVKYDFKVIDSTTISLCLNKYKWAKFRKTKVGVKFHLRLVFADQHDVYSEKLVITTAKCNDRTQMEALIDEEGAMYVFDRGYVDYMKFDEYCDKGIYFASRLKDNAIFHILHSFSLPKDSPVISDSMIILGTPQKRVDNYLRLIETVDSKGNPICIVTN